MPYSASSLNEVVATCEQLLERVRALQQSGAPKKRDALEKVGRHTRLALHYLEGLGQSGLPSSIDDAVGNVVGRQLDGLRKKVKSADAGKAAAAPSGNSAAGFKGDTRTIPLTALIDMLSVQGKDGVLHLHAAQEVVQLYLSDGNVIHATSSQTPAGYRLGEVLVREGAITPDRLREFLKQIAGSRDRLGDALVREELVTMEQMRQALECQVQELFHRLFRMPHVSFEFAEGLPDEIEAQLCLSVTGLVLESARVADEAPLT